MLSESDGYMRLSVPFSLPFFFFAAFAFVFFFSRAYTLLRRTILTRMTRVYPLFSLFDSWSCVPAGGLDAFLWRIPIFSPEAPIIIFPPDYAHSCLHLPHPIFRFLFWAYTLALGASTSTSTSISRTYIHLLFAPDSYFWERMMRIYPCFFFLSFLSFLSSLSSLYPPTHLFSSSSL